MFASSALWREMTTSGVHGFGVMPSSLNSTGSDEGFRFASAMYAFTPRTYDVMMASPCGWYQFNSDFRSPRNAWSRAPMSRFSSLRPRISATVPVA